MFKEKTSKPFLLVLLVSQNRPILAWIQGHRGRKGNEEPYSLTSEDLDDFRIHNKF